MDNNIRKSYIDRLEHQQGPHLGQLARAAQAQKDKLNHANNLSTTPPPLVKNSVITPPQPENQQSPIPDVIMAAPPQPVVNQVTTSSQATQDSIVLAPKNEEKKKRKKKKKKNNEKSSVPKIQTNEHHDHEHCDHAHSHGHSGLLHWVKENYYNKYWLPWLEKVSEWNGGRARSGKVARLARLTRIAVGLISTAAILTFIFTTGGLSVGALVAFWNTGSALPLTAVMGLVAAVVTVGAMLINMAAVQIGTAANFTKIQQYTHAELTNQEWLNEKRTEKIQIPHFWDSPLDKKIMLMVRYAHDFNGFAGSAMSSYLCLACVVAIATPWSLPLSILSASVLFVASRASSMASVLLAPWTNQLRLKYYKNRLNAQADEYYRLHKESYPAIASQIDKIIEGAFNQTTCALIPKNTERLKFLCYRACESAMNGKELDDEQTRKYITTIKNVIANHFDLGNTEINNTVSYLEYLNIVAADIEDGLKHNASKKQKINSTLAGTYEIKKQYPHSLLEHILRAKMEPENIGQVQANMTQSPYIISKAGRPYEIDVEKVKSGFPLESNTHGSEFVPGYHCQVIAESLLQKQTSSQHDKRKL